MNRVTRFALAAALSAPFAFFVPAIASAATINVPVDQPTIQAAVTVASAGDTIVVAAGTYAEHVTVNKSLTLQGANAGIAGNGVRGAESVITGDASGALQLMADNITVDGFKISSASNALGSGIHMAAANMGYLIKNNLITGNQIGIYANSNGSSTISNNLFDANNQAGASGGSGIYSEFTDHMTISNNEFKNHTTNSPVIFGATGSGVHKSLVFSNNNLHNNTNASNVYVLAVATGNFTGNTIVAASDVTGISLSGDDQNVTLTKNTISNAARGIRVEDAGYGLGSNTGIAINRNALTTDSEYGVGNITASTPLVDATCNWWGAANGPGPVGPGSGSPVTTNVTFTNWLTTSDLNGSCTGTTTPPNMLQVHIFKYIDGVQATAANASTTFPMETTFNSSNLGSVVDAPFTLSPTGWGSTDIAYEASFVGSNAGADYQTNEVLGGAVVGASCDGTHAYRLVGYTTGATLAAAASGTPTLTDPSFTNLQSDKYVIVWNAKCITQTAGGSISGIKFEDWDADKLPYESPWEVKLGGWTIYLDTNNNGVLDGGEVSTTTKNNGSYSFTGLAAGTYHVREVQKAGWVGITPTSGKYDVTITNQAVKNKDFGNFKLGSIAGMKFEDKNGNHKKDAGEVGLSGWTIKLSGPNGFASSTVTDANGNYSFGGLMQGNYKLSEVMQTGWKQTVHPKQVTINSDTNAVKKNFGNKHKNTGNPKVDKDDGQDWELDD